MVAQAFKDNDKKHYAAIAVAMAMVPPVADYMYSQITGVLSLANLQTAIQAFGFIHRASLGFYLTTHYVICNRLSCYCHLSLYLPCRKNELV